MLCVTLRLVYCSFSIEFAIASPDNHDVFNFVHFLHHYANNSVEPGRKALSAPRRNCQTHSVLLCVVYRTSNAMLPLGYGNKGRFKIRYRILLLLSRLQRSRDKSRHIFSSPSILLMYTFNIDVYCIRLEIGTRDVQ
jgi:hypothetical protein